MRYGNSDIGVEAVAGERKMKEGLNDPLLYSGGEGG